MTRLGQAACAGLVAAALATATAAAAPITYAINQTIGSGSVVGTIQTDGVTGIVAASDIIGWSLQLNGAGGATFTVTSANSVVQVSGSDLSATATSLLFNYSGADDGYLLFQDGLYSGTQYYCDATSSNVCYQGASVVPQAFNDPSAQFSARAGLQEIATVAATVPEPASAALLGVGLVGLLLRRRRPAK